MYIIVSMWCFVDRQFDEAVVQFGNWFDTPKIWLVTVFINATTAPVRVTFSSIYSISTTSVQLQYYLFSYLRDSIEFKVKTVSRPDYICDFLFADIATPGTYRVVLKASNKRITNEQAHAHVYEFSAGDKHCPQENNGVTSGKNVFSAKTQHPNRFPATHYSSTVFKQLTGDLE